MKKEKVANRDAQDSMIEFLHRKAEVMRDMVHPMRGTGHRSALVGRLVSEHMHAEREQQK